MTSTNVCSGAVSTVTADSALFTCATSVGKTKAFAGAASLVSGVRSCWLDTTRSDGLPWRFCPGGKNASDDGKSKSRGSVAITVRAPVMELDAKDLELHAVGGVEVRIGRVVRVELHVEELFDLDVRGSRRHEPQTGRALRSPRFRGRSSRRTEMGLR